MFFLLMFRGFPNIVVLRKVASSFLLPMTRAGGHKKKRRIGASFFLLHSLFT